MYIQPEAATWKPRNSIFDKDKVLDTSVYSKTQQNEQTTQQMKQSFATKQTNVKLGSQNSTNYLEVHTFQDREVQARHNSLVDRKSSAEVLEGETKVKK